MPRLTRPYLHADGAVIEEIEPVDAETAFAPFANTHWAIWLDSNDPDHAAARYSFIMTAPYEKLLAQSHEANTAFDKLATALRHHEKLWRGLPPELDEILPPFRGGAAGLFGYDLAYGLEDCPPAHSNTASDKLNLPAMAIGLYANVLAIDHKAGRAWLIASGLPATGIKARRAAALDAIATWKKHLSQLPALPLPDPLPAAPLNQLPESNFTADAFRTAVADIVERILSGEIFQANLAQRFRTRLASGDSIFAYYRRLRRVSPAPFSCYANFGDWMLASASPERFLQSRQAHIETRPIKGTRPRSTNPAQDQANAQALCASEKDRAENIMIVDLLRNDLAKRCREHSINVVSLCALESFSNVHHLVSTVTGELADNKTPLDALRGAFPGGSITGAPKIRAMQVIAELEPERRGASYGSVGYIGFDGAMDTNIAIRTAIYAKAILSFQTGGGIVADSCPEAEYRETLNKAHGLLQALGYDSDKDKHKECKTNDCGN